MPTPEQEAKRLMRICNELLDLIEPGAPPIEEGELLERMVSALRDPENRGLAALLNLELALRWLGGEDRTARVAVVREGLVLHARRAA